MAAIVVVSHCSLVYALPSGTRIAFDTLFNPRAAVTFFFVLSGYVLQLALERGPTSLSSTGGFYLRRLLRLIPLVVVVTAFAWVVTELLAVDLPSDSAWFGAATAPPAIRSFEILLAFFALSPVLVPTTWTIFVEMIGSSLLPVQNWARIRLRWGGEILLVLMLALTVTISFTGSLHSARFLVYFAAGAVLYNRRQRWEGLMRQWPRLAVGIMALSALLAFGSRSLWFLAREGALVPLEVDYNNLWVGLLEGLFATILLAGAVTMSGRIEWLRRPQVVRIGDLSFGIYLLHFPVMSALAWGLYRAFGVGGQSPLLHTLLLLGLTWAVVVPASSMAYRWIELPCISAGRRLTSGSGAGSALGG